MTELYTSDAVIFPERSDPITGREGIMRYWSPKPGRRVTRHVLTPTSIVVDGDHAYDHGTYEIAGEREGKAWGPYRGKYVVVWQREGSAWRMQLDIWNSGPPGFVTRSRAPIMQQRIVGFHQDEEGHWVAELECGHGQHVRHDPPWQERPWVTTEGGRRGRLGTLLECAKCEGGRLAG
jgi:ketosteroid isomerase-like protein